MKRILVHNDFSKMLLHNTVHEKWFKYLWIFQKQIPRKCHVNNTNNALVYGMVSWKQHSQSEGTHELHLKSSSTTLCQWKHVSGGNERPRESPSKRHIILFVDDNWFYYTMTWKDLAWKSLCGLNIEQKYFHKYEPSLSAEELNYMQFNRYK